MANAGRYLLAGFLLLGGLGSMLGGAALSGLVLASLGLYFLPPIRTSLGFQPTTGVSALVVIIGFVALFMTSAIERDDNAAQSDEASVEDKAPTEDARAAQQDSLRTVFAADRDAIVTQARELLRQGNAAEAQAKIGPFLFTQDTALVAMRQEIVAAETAGRAQQQLAAKWSYPSTSDPMTSRVSRSAEIRSENTVDFDFPYAGAQHGTLVLRTHPSFGRNVIFRIEQGQLLCNSYDRCTVRVRFDDGEAQSWSGSPPSDNSTTSIFLGNYDGFIQRLGRAQIVRIQPEVYQEGGPVFEFQVGGFEAEKYNPPSTTRAAPAAPAAPDAPSPPVKPDADDDTP